MATRLILLVLALAVAAPAAAKKREFHTKTSFCEREVRQPDRTYARATVETDKAHRPLNRSLLLFSRDNRATWTFPEERFDPARAIDELHSDIIALPKGTPFPVTVTIRFDDKPVWQRQFDRPNTTVVTIPPDRSKPLIRQPGLDLKIEGGQVPSLFGVRRAELLVASAAGQEVARKELPVADWTRLEAEVAEAFAGVESDRRAGRCKPHGYVIIP